MPATTGSDREKTVKGINRNEPVKSSEETESNPFFREKGLHGFRRSQIFVLSPIQAGK